MTFTPSSGITVAAGATQTFALTPAQGFTVDPSVRGTCAQGSLGGSSASGVTYTTGAVTADCTVIFGGVGSTPVTVTPSSDGGVSLSPSTPQALHNGQSAAFAVSVDAGVAASYVPLSDCPAGAWTGNSYATGQLTASCSIDFEGLAPVIGGLSWSATATDIDSTGTAHAAHASVVTDTEIFTYSDHDQDVHAGGTFGFTAVAPSSGTFAFAWDFQGNHAYFAAEASLTAFAQDASGASSPTALIADDTPVSGPFHFSGTSTLTLVAGKPFGFEVLGDNGDSTTTLDGVLTISSISFGAPHHQVTASATNAVTFSPSAVQSVIDGANQTYSLTSAFGAYTAAGTCPAGTFSSDFSLYKTGAITADCTVIFTGVAVHQVTASAATGIVLTPPTQSVANGASASINAAAGAGEAISYLAGGTCAQGTWSNATYSSGAVTADCAVAFSLVTPVLAGLTWTTVIPTGTTNATATAATATAGADVETLTYADSGNEVFQSRPFTMQATAAVSQTYAFAWDYSGFHAYSGAEAGLAAFANGASGKQTVQLVPASTTVSGPFHYSGTASLTLTAGDTFGITATGNNFDSNNQLRGVVQIGTIPSGM